MNNIIKYLIAFLIIICCIGLYVYFTNAQTKGDSLLVDKKEMSSEGINSCPDGLPPQATAYHWSFENVPEGVDGIPHTKVTLQVDESCGEGSKSVVVNSDKFNIGTYEGSCNEIQQGEKGVTGEYADRTERSRVQCWFAGGGNEIGVYQVDFDWGINVLELGEGDGDNPPFRGNGKALPVQQLKIK